MNNSLAFRWLGCMGGCVNVWMCVSANAAAQEIGNGDELSTKDHGDYYAMKAECLCSPSWFVRWFQNDIALLWKAWINSKLLFSVVGQRRKNIHSESWNIRIENALSKSWPIKTCTEETTKFSIAKWDLN